MSEEQQITEMILKDSLKKISMHREIFRRISSECQNHIYPVSMTTPRCNRRRNKSGLCEVFGCPLLKEEK